MCPKKESIYPLLQNLVFKCNAFRVNSLELGLGSVFTRKDLKVVLVADLLAGIVIDHLVSTCGAPSDASCLLT